MQDLSQVAEQASARGQQFWQGLGGTQKVAIVAVGTLGVAILALFVLWARTPSYTLAYSNLSEEDAGAVVAKLRETKVPYQVREGGAILVPTDQMHDVRLQLAAAGLPQGGAIGFELFDKTNFGLTDFAQKINYQRALEGELSRTINRLEAVEQSRVHIVMPQPSLYTDKAKDATASVVLRLHPGRQLTRAQLRGVAHLVSGSVEGLKLENLTIVDGKGNVLFDPASQDNADPSSSLSKVEAQQSYENRIEGNLQKMLDRIVGPNRTTVRVSATLDWDRMESNSEIFSPEGSQAQVRSQRTISETFADGKQSAAGIPGVDSNIPTYQALTGTTSTSVAVGGQRTESTVNYELSRRTDRLVRAPGNLRRLSVAVAVDSTAVATDQVEALRQVVSAAVGLDPQRGDVVTLTPMAFDKGVDQPFVEGEQNQEFVLSLIRIGVIGASTVLVLVFLWLMLRRPRRRPRDLTPAQLQLLAGKTIGLPSAAQPTLPQPRSEEEIHQDRVQQQIQVLARENPVMLAQLIQTWLEEDRWR